MSKVLVTGASGFVGRHLCRALLSSNHVVRGTARFTRNNSSSNSIEFVATGEIGANTDWSAILQDIDCVVHLAGRVHIMRETEPDPYLAFRCVNVEGTRNLLSQVKNSNVRRFVYISSIKVHGESTISKPLNVGTAPNPLDPYARSKWEAEQIVVEADIESDVETVIIRPPLVYGPGVRGNFLKLLRIVDKGYPLPLMNIRNQRSLVSVANLCDFICKCLEDSRAAGQVFLVSDGSDLATPELIRVIASAMGRPANLFPVPTVFLNTVSKLIGKSNQLERLAGSLQVDSSDTTRLLGWTPPQSIEAGIQATVKRYLEDKVRDIG